MASQHRNDQEREAPVLAIATTVVDSFDDRFVLAPCQSMPSTFPDILEQVLALLE